MTENCHNIRLMTSCSQRFHCNTTATTIDWRLRVVVHKHRVHTKMANPRPCRAYLEFGGLRLVLVVQLLAGDELLLEVDLQLLEASLQHVVLLLRALERHLPDQAGVIDYTSGFGLFEYGRNF